MASAGDARYPASIPGLGISPGEGNGNPLQYSYLENCLDRGAWRATAVGLQRVERGLVNEHTLDRSVCPVLEAGALRLRRSRPFSLGGPRGACTMHPPFCWVPHPWLTALTPALASRGLTLSHVFFRKISVYFWLPWVSVAACWLSLVAVQGLHCGWFLVAEHGL